MRVIELGKTSSKDLKVMFAIYTVDYKLLKNLYKSNTIILNIIESKTKIFHEVCGGGVPL